MPVAEGFFVDWDGNARNTLDPGGGYVCETEAARWCTKAPSIKRSPTSERPASKHRLSLDHTHGAGRTKDSESAVRRKGDPDMLPTTILVDEAPRRVVRPNDVKDLNRFIRNGKTFLLAENSVGKITHRNVVTDAARPYRKDCRPGCASNRRASRANRKSPAGPQPPQQTLLARPSYTATTHRVQARRF